MQPVHPRDVLALRFFRALVVVMFLYGVGAVCVVFWGDEDLARVMLTAFSAMFAGVLGFGSGYLVGRKKNGEE